MPRAESSPAEDRGDAVAIIEWLHRVSWSIGDVPLRGRGWLVWIVLGRRGADLLIVSGPTHIEAWRWALDQAATCGMLLDQPRPARE